MLLLAILLTVYPVYCLDVGTVNPKVRLVDGPTRNEGRVEVLANGAWGTVCDDDFGIEDANVICRMLGYSGALQFHTNAAHYGEGSGKIWIDNLGCTGNESDLFECPMNAIGKHNCGHNEDVGVKCNGNSPPLLSMALPVRLVCPFNKTRCNNIPRKRWPDADECSSSVHIKGIVQVYHNKKWRFVSAEGWDNVDVSVVCGQLGFPLGAGTIPRLLSILPKGTKVHKNKKKNYAKVLRSVVMKNVHCSGSESKLEECVHDGFGTYYNPSGKVATASCAFRPHPSCGKCQPNVSINCVCMCVRAYIHTYIHTYVHARMHVYTINFSE